VNTSGTIRAILFGTLSVFYGSVCYSQTHLPYDFVVVTTDSNGWPLNPLWGAQVPSVTSLPNWLSCPGQEPWKSTCTSSSNWSDKSEVKCPDTVFQHVPYPGHINFAGAVLTGTVSWADHSGDDDDYNLDFIPDGGGGLTTTNPQSIRLEFDSDETIDHFHTSWWSEFHKAVDNSSADAKALIDGKRAIAFGVVGLDCAHDCSNELHPVFALAIEVNPDPQDNQWAIFVRNWGDEGYCSSGSEVLDDSISQFTFMLPHPWASNVVLTQAEFLSRGLGGTGPAVELVPGKGASVTFGFPVASKRERINGILHLTWAVKIPPLEAAVVHRPPVKASTEVIPHRFPAQATTMKEPEEIVGSWIERMTPQQRVTYERLRPKRDLSQDSVSLPRAALRPVVLKTTLQTAVRPTPDPARDARDAQALQAVKTAYKGKLPEVTAEDLRVK
jgi:hypothetical protein